MCIRDSNSIDGIYEHIEDIKGKLKDKLIDGKQSAYMSLELGRIARQTPLEPTFEEYGGYDFRKEEVINLSLIHISICYLPLKTVL